MAEITTPATLAADLARLSHGGVLKLAPGAYPFTSIVNRVFDAETVIEAADPADRPVFDGLSLSNVQNLTLRGIAAGPAPAEGRSAANNGISVFSGCARIRLEDCRVSAAENVRPYPQGNGVFIRGARDVTVERLEARWFYHGLGHLDCDGLTITDSHFHDLQSDGVRGGGTNDLLIARNRFRSFHIAPGDHGDAVQVWTTNVKRLTERVTVADNLVERGEGAIIQGIFVRDQAGTGYRGVTVTGNAVVGMYLNAIFVQGRPPAVMEGVEVSDNLVLGFGDQEGRLRFHGVSGGRYAGNRAGLFQFAECVGLVDGGGNVQLVKPIAADGAHLADWLATHPNVPGAPKADPRDARIAELEAMVNAARLALGVQ